LKLPHRLRLQLVTFKNQRFPHAKMLIPDQKASQQTSTEEHHTINAGVEPPAVEFLELYTLRGMKISLMWGMRLTLTGRSRQLI
jgi:hypothetical protein